MRLQQDLVALDPVLLDLVKFALEFSLALQALLRSTHVDEFPVELRPVHFINCLEEQQRRRTWKVIRVGPLFSLLLLGLFTKTPHNGAIWKPRSPALLTPVCIQVNLNMVFFNHLW